jgi:hypothetical protein
MPNRNILRMKESMERFEDSCLLTADGGLRPPRLVRRVLRRADQEKLDSLFDLASQHFPAAEYVPHALPFEIMLLTMLLEEHKEVLKLREKIAALTINNPKEHLPSL